PEPAPAPVCTATSAPRPFIRRTVSGVAATRGSPPSTSAGIAIFMLPPMAACQRSAGHTLSMDRARQSDLRMVTGPPSGPCVNQPTTSGEEDGHEDEDHRQDDDGPLRELDEEPVGPLVLRVVVTGRSRIFDLTVVGHFSLPG